MGHVTLALMNIEEVIERFRWELRNLQWDGENLEQAAAVTRRITSIRNACDITCFAVNNENAEELIREEIIRAQALKVALEWKVFSFDFSGFVPRLKSAGFSVGEREAMVVYDLNAGLHPFEEPGRDSVHRVTGVEMLGDFQSAYTAAFSQDCSATVAQLAEALQAGRSGHDAYLAYVDGVPASVGRLYTHPKSAFAGLYGGGTSPSYRGRGLYRAIVAARARDALKAGARYLLVDAMPTSLPILLRLGFVRVAESWPCTLDFSPK